MLDRPDRGLWAVADGMGGHSAGDVAAAITVEALEALANASAPITAASVQQALLDANARIMARRSSGGSGTTIVALLAQNDEASLFWAGDSRAYLIRGGDLRRLTRDHSVVQEMVDAGLLSEGQAVNHPRANMITRALGIAPDPQIETAGLKLMPGDRVMLCSDGLYRSLRAEDLLPDAMIDAIAHRLMLNSLQRDGSDNSSLVLVGIV